MARTKCTPRDIGGVYKAYRSGPANIPVYVFPGGTRNWSTVAPTMRSLARTKVIYVTRDELSGLKRKPTSMSALYGYERRVRDIEAGDLSATDGTRVLQGVPTLPVNFTEAQLREYQNACANLKSSPDYESFRAALITGEINAKKALGFMHLAADAKSTEVEKDAYLTVARFIATAKHRMRDSKDFTGELPDVPEETRRHVMKLIGECGFTGSLRSAFELDFVRTKLRVVGAKGQNMFINVLRREGRTDAVFCPGYATTKAFAELVGLDKKARDYAKRKGKECRDRFHPPTEADRYRPWTCRPRIQHHRELVPYVAELIHGYYVVYLTDIDTQWHGDVGEDEVMWAATEVKGKKRGRE
ncbi:uncharacterized protein MICPUCDRAFT_54905 [Micromonas pusilla CCMP1545]|uniref:Predicted protein n=1 Tax=Micromonas pusilla (strain CCMP1545) TaxID=564608 RepID=C1NAH2_MICPC|nr:uncharacterized protein MICPUCDRAFT_54905 [Micromonas pusilla CCMP1545]EEH50939.1 predicted protein [Micromonas pusilla CCMP1545]|eukprot:XP_003064959.1 predicted protein [Micromonas pusilla CCMP1545]